jgi:hypothetical protein
MTPVRVQRKRTKGWRMPENTVYVGRGTPWGNPFRVTQALPAEDVVKVYREWLMDERRFQLRANLRHYLRGKNLACWCALDQPCHADVLLELANG